MIDFSWEQRLVTGYLASDQHFPHAPEKAGCPDP
jgi:hypothetical protein